MMFDQESSSDVCINAAIESQMINARPRLKIGKKNIAESAIRKTADGNRTDVTANSSLDTIKDRTDVQKRITSIKVIEDADLWRAIKKFSNKYVMTTVQAVYDKGPQNFREIQEATKLETNDINHALHDLKALSLVIQKDDKRYYLTKYCVILIESLNLLKDHLSTSDTLFEPLER